MKFKIGDTINFYSIMADYVYKGDITDIIECSFTIYVVDYKWDIALSADVGLYRILGYAI